MQAGREGFDRAYPAAACSGKPVIQGNASGTLFKRLLDAGTAHQFGEAARQLHDACSFGILFDPGERRDEDMPSDERGPFYWPNSMCL
jgi:hypothetical protein